MNANMEKRELVDMLIHKIRLEGYQIVNRRYGKYLPDPQPVGGYDIDILAKRGGTFIIGICLDSTDLVQQNLQDKLQYLATRTSKFSNQPVFLYIGIDQALYVRLAQVMQQLPNDVRSRIRSYPLTDAPMPDLFFNVNREPQPRHYVN